ncbi:MAG TPA: DUF5329 family protein [Gammaproteobacteria bacterium]|nr:DUF5329 family protein [Gammaproteobacteria bacterium]
MKWLLVLLSLLPALSLAADRDALESRKIDYLIEAIEHLDNAQFIRNGKALHGRVASNNFRLKLKKPRCDVSTAQDFIRICAAASWASGRPYEIRFADGTVMLAKDYLRQKLSKFEAGNGVDSADKT